MGSATERNSRDRNEAVAMNFFVATDKASAAVPYYRGEISAGAVPDIGVPPIYFKLLTRLTQSTAGHPKPHP